MFIETPKYSSLRLIIRELIGLYRYFKAQIIYRSKNHPVYLSDFSLNSPKKKNDQDFESFFMEIEDVRNKSSKRISKNVTSSLTYFSTAIKFIPHLENNCYLKRDFKVLDYGSGGLRCGFGLLDFLNISSYSCADITDSFLMEAKKNSFLLSQLYENKRGKFFKIGSDKIPNNYYDLVISTYVVPHIPKDKLSDYFISIEKYLKKDGFFYFDFMPSPICLKQNVTTFTYPYRLIINKLNSSGMKIVKTSGSGIFAKKYMSNYSK